MKVFLFLGNMVKLLKIQLIENVIFARFIAVPYLYIFYIYKYQIDCDVFCDGTLLTCSPVVLS